MVDKRPRARRVKRPARFQDGLIFLPLGNGYEAIVDDTPENRELTCFANWHRSSPRGADGPHYAVTNLPNRGGIAKLHRMLLKDAPIVDHINRNGLDNRLCNLRAATHSENMMNTPPPRGRAVKGAFLRPNGKWQCLISINGKAVGGGTFDTMEAAHARWLELATLRNARFVRGS